MLKLLTLALILTCLASPALLTAEDGPAITDVKTAGPDFEIQGEYKGTGQSREGEKVFGAQVIALGDGNFTVAGYHGGLPGDGWIRGDEHTTTQVKRSKDKVVGQLEKADIQIADGKISVFVEGKEVAKLSKVERKSPTLSAKPPQGAVVLFDGTSAEHFENGKLVEESLLAATNCVSKQKFGDHQLHIEFRTPFMPTARGQGRGNSGVYLQGRYELQVLDSFGLAGANNECGGIYSIAEPLVNMCLPPLSWQTYDVDFIAARFDDEGKKTKNAKVTIKHNGIVIQNNIDLKHGTPGYHEEGPEADGLFLQDHGNPVVFRNIWVVEK